MRNIVIYPKKNKGKISQNPISIGIDLGTTYALMATIDNEHVNFENAHKLPVQFVRFPQHSPFEFDQTIEDEKIATIIAFYKGKPYVGNNLYHLKGHPEFQYKKNIFYHWKVEMGVDLHPLYPEAVNEKLDMPYKIAGAVMNYMRKVYSENNDYELGNTIITVPASFQANQRKDTLRAAEMAKIEEKEGMLIDEPNAAFLGYFNRLSDENKERWAREVKNKNVLVLDFGGGTLDLSLLNVDFRKDSGITIGNKAISRYNDLGGQDIDLLIAEEVILPKAKEIIPNFDHLNIGEIRNEILPQLTVMGEDLKKGICNKVSLKTADGNVDNLQLENVFFSRDDNTFTFNNEEYLIEDLSISGSTFRDLFIKFFRKKTYQFRYSDKTITTVSSSISEIVEKANETLDAIDYVLFVGGSSFNPFLPALTKKKLTNSRLLLNPDPDKLVAEGAAIYSYFLNQYGVSLIKPITSDTLGVRVKDNRFKPIIERGQSLPQKVELPDFKLQTNLNPEVIVPVCINGADFLIGEIRCPLNDFYDIDTTVKINAEITADKVFKLEVYAEENLIGQATFENPYAIGKLTEDELELYKVQTNLNKARISHNVSEEKRLLREVIDKHYEVSSNLSGLEAVENYIERFDDQDSWVWNMKYILNDRLGRREAAKDALERAIELSPESGSWRYNYSVLLEKDDPQKALEYLNNQDENIKKDNTVRCKIALLEKEVNDNRSGIKEIIEKHKKSPEIFSEFDKRVLLGPIYRESGEAYGYVNPKTKKRKEDEKRYLDTDNKPLNL